MDFAKEIAFSLVVSALVGAVVTFPIVWFVGPPTLVEAWILAVLSVVLATLLHVVLHIRGIWITPDEGVIGPIGIGAFLGSFLVILMMGGMVS